MAYAISKLFWVLGKILPFGVTTSLENYEQFQYFSATENYALELYEQNSSEIGVSGPLDLEQDLSCIMRIRIGIDQLFPTLFVLQ